MSFRYSFLHAAVRKKIGRWLVVLGEFAISQGLGQAAGMLVGLIYVRMMPTDQYAVYALCMATLAMVSVGSDLGLTGSLSYFWRQSLQERGAIGPKSPPFEGCARHCLPQRWWLAGFRFSLRPDLTPFHRPL